MKKTLLVAAFAAIAGMASAQTSEVLRTTGGFTFIPQNLAEKANYSIPIAYNWNNENEQLQVYDANLNQERTFDILDKSFSFKSYDEVATVKASKASISNWNTGWEGNSNEGITDYESWVAFAKKYVGEDAVFFTDPDGNWAAYLPTNIWDKWYDKANRSVNISLWYMCFDKVKQVPRNGYCVIVLNLPDNIDWQKTGETSKIYSSWLEPLTVYDYSSAIPAKMESSFSQTLFNEDDKIEYSLCYEKEVTEDEFGVDVKISKLSDDLSEVTLSRKTQDKYSKQTIGIFDEAGNEVISFPAGTTDVKVYKANGNTYLNAYENYYNVLYLLDKTSSSIQELTRSKAASNAPTFNLAGMKTNKDAKGVVIQKGGIKYINK